MPSVLEPLPANAAPAPAAPPAATADAAAHPHRWWLEAALLLAVCALGLAVRVYGLRTMPPGLYNDEAAYAIDARSVVNGVRVIFFEANSGREPLFIYLLAAAFALLGDNPYSVRLTAALVGALTIPAAWFMARAAAQFAMQTRDGREHALMQRMAPWLAPWVALLLALSSWHLSLSRLGFRAITLPLVLAIASAFLFRALRRLMVEDRLPWSDLLLTGFFTGLTFYTYMAARVVPVFMVVALTLSIVAAPRLGLPRRRMTVAAAAIVIVMIVTMLPLLIYFARHPYFFAGHALDISILNGRFSTENPVVTLLQNAGKFVLMFFTLPDPELRHNPGARPAFDVVMGLWMCVGIVLGLLHWKRFTLSYFVLWALILAVPSMLSASSIPSSLRAIGMMPGIFVLPVAAMLWAGARLAPGHPRLAALTPLPFVLVSGMIGVRAYFTSFAVADRFTMHFLVAYVELGEALHAQPDAALWIVPLSDVGVRMEERLTTVDYLVNNPKHFHSIALDPATVSADLQRITAGVKQVKVMDLYGLPRFDIYTSFLDNKKILDFLLARDSVASQPQQGRTDALATTSVDGLTSTWIPYDTYTLKETTDFALPSALRPADVRFADHVRLEGIATGAAGSTTDSPMVQLHSDELLWAVLAWNALQPIDDVLKSSLILLDAKGQVVGQVDKLLMGDLYPAQRVWAAGDTTRTYHLLQAQAGTPPGMYQLALSVYEDKSGRVYPATNADGTVAARTVLGTVELLPPLAAPVIAPQVALTDTAAGGQAGAEVGLVGYDLPRTLLAPGEALGLTLYWQAAITPTQELTAVVELVDAGGDVVARAAAAPGGAGYATTAWRPGFAVRDLRTLPLAATTPAGAYTLRVRLQAGEKLVRETQLGGVGAITVAGRPRLMEQPPVARPLAAHFGDTVRLVGVNGQAASTPAPGATLELSLVWQALRTGDAPLVRSLQVLNAAGVLVAQQDGEPCRAQCPAASWLASEYLVDDVALALPAEMAPGVYHVIVGWYDPATQQRLPARGGDGAPLPDNMASLPDMVVK